MIDYPTTPPPLPEQLINKITSKQIEYIAGTACAKCNACQQYRHLCREALLVKIDELQKLVETILPCNRC